MTEIKEPNAPATKRQTFAIFSLGGGDVRSAGLTRAQASSLIQELKLKLKAEANSGTKVPAKSGPDYEAIMAEANEAAGAAAQAWLDKASVRYVVKDGSGHVHGTMLDVCGFAWVVVGDKRTKFAKWLASKDLLGAQAMMLRHKHSGRQELSLLEAGCRAAYEVFKRHGVDRGLRVESRID